MTLKLIIVDDSELIRTRLIGLLEGIKGAISIDTADTLVHAWESVRRVVPTLITLDLHLSDGNAIQIINPLKQLAPAMQIAVLTNDSSEFNRNKCMQAGADWFFDKSTEFEAVLEVVQGLAALK